MESRYLAFLLRMWQVNSNDYTVWRASLENPHTGERHAFASLEDMCLFLGAETNALAHQEPAGRRSSEEQPSQPT
jgi:hypothetical protein